MLDYMDMIIDKGYTGYNPIHFGWEICAPSKFMGPAVTTVYEFHYIISGTGIFKREDDETEFKVDAGDIFIINPYQEFFYQADSKNPWHYIWVGFLTDMELPDELKQPVIHCPGAGRIFEDMRRSREMENGKSAFLSSKIWEIISLILEKNTNDNNIDYIEKALHFINTEYANDINTTKVAHALNISRCYFSTLFKEHIGTSPTQYLINLRLEKAAELMVSYNKNITIAASSVGYNDIYTFSKMFKKKFGCSPRQYVNKFKSNK